MHFCLGSVLIRLLMVEIVPEDFGSVDKLINLLFIPAFHWGFYPQGFSVNEQVKGF